MPETCQKYACNAQLDCVIEALPTGATCTGADTVGCTVDACDGKGKCVVAKNDDTLCDDGLACTSDTCDAKADCQHVPADAACDDGNVCSVGDKCLNGSCKTGTAIWVDTIAGSTAGFADKYANEWGIAAYLGCGAAMIVGSLLKPQDRNA